MLSSDAQKAGKPPSRVTISDVADAIGVTKSTVSRALNGYPDISEKMRLKVRNAVEELGYRPMAQAQAIRTGRARAMGLVLQLDEHDAHRPFLTNFLAGLSEAASRELWTLTVATARSTEDTLKTIGRLVEERKADGFILPRTYIEDARVDYLRAHDVPFVLYGRTGDMAGCASYDILGERAMEDAVVRLAELGHRRIAFINGGEAYNYSVLRREGFEAGLRRAGLPLDPALMAAPALTTMEGCARARTLMELSLPPTAFVCAGDTAALGVYRAVGELGLTVGQHVSVISYDGIPDGETASPPLTTFAVDSHRAGGRLAHLLIARIRGEAPETLREMEAAQLLLRGSDRPPLMPSPELAAVLRDGA